MAEDWKDFAALMKQDNMPVARVDLWRYLACEPMPIAAFGAAFNREVQPQDPILLGYSMGGRLALHALIDNPTKWSKAIIISAHTGIPQEEKPARQANDAEWAAKALKGDWAAFIQQWNKQAILNSTAMPQRESLKSRREAVARSFMDWSLGVQGDLLSELPKISCPVLWLVGERDTKFLKVAESAVATMPHAELAVIPDCGHRVPWENSDLFVKIVKDFLKS